MEKASFAAGCFWGVENLFRKLEGVIDTRVGYIGGHTEDPSYKEVCKDQTGHAEAVEVTYDPAQISYQRLLTIFWENHNPTTLNRQGPDIGSQYRSAIFYHNQAQKETALKSKEELANSNKYQQKIVTEIEAASTFYQAEDYHQQYVEKKGLDSCHI